MIEVVVKDFLTWLHISDAHIGGPQSGWDAEVTLKSLREDFRRLSHAHALRPDLIFFTGDAAWGHPDKNNGSCLVEQFDCAARFFENIRNMFEPAVPRENVFIVPGNHDINRDNIAPPVTGLLDAALDAAAGPVVAADELFGGISGEVRPIMSRLNDYRRFLGVGGFYQHSTDPDRLVYAESRKIGNIKIGVAGFNSAWSCARKKEKGRLLFGVDAQVRELGQRLQQADIRVGLIHHPPNWFNGREAALFRQLFPRYFDFLLHGHEHNGLVTVHGDHVVIAAGTCHAGAGHLTGYNFCRVMPEHNRAEVWLREYEGGAGRGWAAQLVPGKTDQHGRWPLKNVLQESCLPPSIIGESCFFTP